MKSIPLVRHEQECRDRGYQSTKVYCDVCNASDLGTNDYAYFGCVICGYDLCHECGPSSVLAREQQAALDRHDVEVFIEKWYNQRLHRLRSGHR